MKLEDKICVKKKNNNKKIDEKFLIENIIMII